MTHSELVNIAHRWLLRSGGAGVAFKELVCMGWETPDALGIGGTVNSIVIECKVSRSDFLADLKKPFRIAHPEMGMGTHRIYCAPEGLLRLEELPPKWALLSVLPNGRTQLTYRPDVLFPRAKFLSSSHAQQCNREAERQVMYSALRRLQQVGAIEQIHPKRLQVAAQ
jgi:hypothetical protein